MANRFDVMKWLRKVREDNYKATRNLTPEQLIAQTRAGAEAFEKSQPKVRARVTRKPGSR